MYYAMEIRCGYFNSAEAKEICVHHLHSVRALKYRSNQMDFGTETKLYFKNWGSSETYEEILKRDEDKK